MRIISQLAKNTKKEDTFGLNDDDWEVYKKISVDGGDSDSEEESLRCAEYEAILKEHDTQDDEVDPDQSSPKPTPIPTVKAITVMNIMAKARGCSLIADFKLTGRHKQHHFVDLET